MGDLRAPDPTLTALGSDDVTLTYQGEAPPVAHRLVPAYGFKLWPACPEGMDELRIEADWSAWFAVPCRECFPDAPPPGHTYEPGGSYGHVPHWWSRLAWQVPDQEAASG